MGLFSGYFFLSAAILVSIRLLTDDLQERLTAKEAMAHPYFNPVRDEHTFQQSLANASTAGTGN